MFTVDRHCMDIQECLPRLLYGYPEYLTVTRNCMDIKNVYRGLETVWISRNVYKMCHD